MIWAALSVLSGLLFLAWATWPYGTAPILLLLWWLWVRS